MTIRARSLFLPAIFLFIITSCVPVDNRMGSGFIPSNQVVYIHTQDFAAPNVYYGRPEQYGNMAAPSYLEFGSVNTPVFGNTTSSGHPVAHMRIKKNTGRSGSGQYVCQHSHERFYRLQ